LHLFHVVLHLLGLLHQASELVFHHSEPFLRIRRRG
jgi:hypothetical protein